MMDKSDSDVMERKLLTRISAGDSEAFWELWEKHKHALHYQCAALLRGRYDDVEDVLSETMMKAWKYLRFNTLINENAFPWLRSILDNACIDFLNSAKHESTPLSNDDIIKRPAAESHSPDRIAIGRMNLESRLREVDRLPKRFRDIFILRKIHNLPYAEIAGRFRMTPHAVEERVHLAGKYLEQQKIQNLPPEKMLEEIHAQISDVRFAAVDTPHGGVVSYRVHLEEKLPFRKVRVQTLRDRATEHPCGWRIRLDLANLLFAMAEWEEAAAHYWFALNHQPGRIDLWLRLGVILRGLERYDEARGVYEKALKLADTVATRSHISGWIAICNGSIQSAITSFQRAADLEPDNSAHWHAIGFIARDAQMDVESVAAFDRALAINPDDVVALGGSHDSLQSEDRNAELIRRLYRAVELNPNDPTALKLLAVHRCANGYVWGKEGIKTLRLAKRAVLLAPDSTEAWESLCNYYSARGKVHHDLTLWQEFLQNHPRDSRTWMKYSVALQNTPRIDLALDAIRRANQLAPDNYYIKFTYSEAITEYGPTEEVKCCVDDLLDGFAHFWGSHICAGMAFVKRLGDHDRGCRAAQQAVRLQPGLSAAWSCYASVLWEAGERRESQKAQEHACELMTDVRPPQRSLLTSARWREMREESRAEEWLHNAIEDARKWTVVSPSFSAYYIGVASEALGDRKVAYDSFQEALHIGLLDYFTLQTARAAAERLK